ncbi:hypothetical protein [Vibrio splendidus]|nr:hypothetical protein [Vibrio splendidus]
MTDTALVGRICVDIRKSMSRFVDAYDLGKNGLAYIKNRSEGCLLNL